MKTFKIVGAVFSFVGIGLLVGGLILLIYGEKQMNQWEPVVGILSDSEPYLDSDGDYSERFYVTYEVDGKEYIDRMDYYSSGMDIGDEVELYINPANPFEIMSAGGSRIGGGILTGMGAIFAVLGLCLWIPAVKKDRRYKRLRTSGNRMRAQVESCTQNRSVRVNGRFPWVIDCSVIDAYTGGKHLFHSGNIYKNLYHVAENPQAYSVDVYTDLMNWDEYIVDGDTITDGAMVYDHGSRDELF